MLVKIESRIPIFPGTDFHFPSTSVPPGTFLRLCERRLSRCCRYRQSIASSATSRPSCPASRCPTTPPPPPACTTASGSSRPRPPPTRGTAARVHGTAAVRPARRDPALPRDPTITIVPAPAPADTITTRRYRPRRPRCSPPRKVSTPSV